MFLRKITRGATATDIPILPNTEVERGDMLTLVGRTQDTTGGDQDARRIRTARPMSTDMAFIGGRSCIGALIGALVYQGRRRAAHPVDRPAAR